MIEFKKRFLRGIFFLAGFGMFAFGTYGLGSRLLIQQRVKPQTELPLLSDEQVANHLLVVSQSQGAEALDIILGYAKHPAHTVRASVAMALGFIKSPTAEEQLKLLVQDEAANVRFQAERSLRQIQLR